MDGRLVSLWFVLIDAALVTLILVGLLLGFWRDGELRFRFSLSTLMIATALVAMLCGSVVYVITIIDPTH